jgi:hypothetical protein
MFLVLWRGIVDLLLTRVAACSDNEIAAWPVFTIEFWRAAAETRQDRVSAQPAGRQEDPVGAGSSR